MEKEINSNYPEEIKRSETQKTEIEMLKEKVNVDDAAIEEAKAAVGDDIEKIKEYLINNRGL